MATRTYATTNQRLSETIAGVDELIAWAEEDAQHAAENGAIETARDDKRRVKILRRVRNLLTLCER